MKVLGFIPNIIIERKIRTCGKEIKWYTKYKWYSKKWIIKICGKTDGYVCDECKAYNNGYNDALHAKSEGEKK